MALNTIPLKTSWIPGVNIWFNKSTMLVSFQVGGKGGAGALYTSIDNLLDSSQLKQARE